MPSYEFAKVHLFFDLNKKKYENCKHLFVNCKILFVKANICHCFFAIMTLQFQRLVVNNAKVGFNIVFNVCDAVRIDTFDYLFNRIRYAQMTFFHNFVILYNYQSCIWCNQSHLIYICFCKKFVFNLDNTFFALFLA